MSPTTATTMTGKDKYAVICALRTAAEKYDEAAEVCDPQPGDNRKLYTTIAADFRQQAADARRIAAELEDADHVEVIA
jgi:hypothetical protein